MNNLYVRTIGWIVDTKYVHVEPYEEVGIERDGEHYRIITSNIGTKYDTTNFTQSTPTKADYIAIDVLQICIKLDGELYVMEEVEIYG